MLLKEEHYHGGSCAWLMQPEWTIQQIPRHSKGSLKNVIPAWCDEQCNYY